MVDMFSAIRIRWYLEELNESDAHNAFNRSHQEKITLGLKLCYVPYWIGVF